MNPSLTIFSAFPPKRFSAELKKEMPASFLVNPARIKASLLPEQVVGANGVVFRRPQKWNPSRQQLVGLVGHFVATLNRSFATWLRGPCSFMRSMSRLTDM